MIEKQYALFARPIHGTARMVVSVHATEAEAEAERVRQTEKRAQHWYMYTGPVVRDEEVDDDLDS